MCKSWCDLNLAFDLAVMTLTFKILSSVSYISETIKCGKLVRGYGWAASECDLEFTFDLAVMTLTFKILSRLYLTNRLSYILGTVRRRKLILG